MNNMAYTITDKCDKAGACKPVCPVDAISEQDTKFVIDEDLCVECGACAAACPKEAIEAPK
jgi:Fe-S-cluster-containing hydrogenase component 2